MNINKKIYIDYFENLFFMINDTPIDYSNNKDVLNLFNLIQMNLRNNFYYSSKKSSFSNIVFDHINYFQDKVDIYFLKNSLFDFLKSQPLDNLYQIDLFKELKPFINKDKWNNFILSFFSDYSLSKILVTNPICNSFLSFFTQEINIVIQDSKDFIIPPILLFKIFNISSLHNKLLIDENTFMNLLFKDNLLLNFKKENYQLYSLSIDDFLNNLYVSNFISDTNKQFIFDSLSINKSYFYSNHLSIAHIIYNSNFDNQKLEQFLNKINFQSKPTEIFSSKEFTKFELFKLVIINSYNKIDISNKIFQLLNIDFQKNSIIFNFFLQDDSLCNIFHTKHTQSHCLKGIDLFFNSFKGKKLVEYKNDFPNCFINYEKIQLNKNLLIDNNLSPKRNNKI